MELTYTTPIENHNPIEMVSTIAVWEARDRLLLYESTRWIKGIQAVAANAFGLPLDQVRVIAPFVGGVFGSKGFTWNHLLVTASAARLVDRPVKLHFSRRQMFDSAGQRAGTRQTISTAADEHGRLTAIRHRMVTHCSPVSPFTEPCGNMTRRLYACDHVEMTHRLLHVNLTSPCPMRALGEAPGVFALECAMDEMAEKLGLDPLDFRLRNYAEVDPEEKRPWSSKQVRRCYDRAAARFGWSERPRRPRSMQGADGALRGWGMATAVYPANQMPAFVHVRLDAQGHATLQSATHEIGTGPRTRTRMTQLAADSLGLAPDEVTFELGDSVYPEAPVNGGSWLTASAGAAVIAACEELKLVRLASVGPDAIWPGIRVGCRGGGVGSLNDSEPWLSYPEFLQKTKNNPFKPKPGQNPARNGKRFRSFLSGRCSSKWKLSPGPGTSV